MPPEENRERIAELIRKINSGDGGIRELPTLFGTIERAKIDQEARTIELPFSSETPVEQWWGMEILDHAPAAVDLSRFKPQNFGAVLDQHNPGSQIGVVQKAWIDENSRKGRATLKISRSPAGEIVWQDILDGIRGNVSVGYEIRDLVLEREEKNKPPLYRVTKWAPFEISFVSVPADIKVGVGRSVDPNPTATVTSGKEGTMPPIEENRTVAAATATPAQETTSQPTIQGEDREKRERARASEIMSVARMVAERTHDSGVFAIATDFIANGRTAAEFRQAMFEKMVPEGAIRIADPPVLGMGKAEVRRYRFMRLLRALIAEAGERARLEKEAAFEFECSREFSKIVGRDPRSAWIPAEVLEGVPDPELARELMHKLRSTRDMQVSGTGQYLVAQDFQGASFIELLYNRSVVMGLATVLTGLNGNVAIPKQTGGATLYWLAEGGAAATESDPVFAQIGLTPKMAAGIVDYSRRFFLQTSIGAEALVRADFVRKFACGIDEVALEGGGTNQPTGILATGSGVTDVSMGSPNGGPPTWLKIVEFESDVAAANADMGRLAYVTNAKVRGKCKTVIIDTGSGIFIWDVRTPAAPLNGLPAFVTNAIRSNFVEGTSSNCSGMIFGNWEDLLIGLWGGLDIFVNPYFASGTGNVRIEAYQSLDVALRRTESFAASKDITTT